MDWLSVDIAVNPNKYTLAVIWDHKYLICILSWPNCVLIMNPIHRNVKTHNYLTEEGYGFYIVMHR